MVSFFSLRSLSPCVCVCVAVDWATLLENSSGKGEAERRRGGPSEEGRTVIPYIVKQAQRKGNEEKGTGPPLLLSCADM